MQKNSSSTPKKHDSQLDEPAAAPPPILQAIETLKANDPVEKRQRQIESRRRKTISIIAVGFLAALLGTAIAMTQRQLDSNNSLFRESSARNLVQRTNLTSLLEDGMGAIGTGTMSRDIAGPDYQVSGYDFLAQADRSDSLGFTVQKNTSDFDLIAKKIKQFFKSRNFKQINYGTESNQTIVHETFESDEIICGTTYPKARLQKEGSILTVSCANKSSYINSARAQKPFYEAYRKATKDDKTSIGLPSITHSTNTGYEKATAGAYKIGYTGGTIAHFYRTPDKTWHYFSSGQEIFGCDKYTDEDAKKAYAGMLCLDNSTGRQKKL